MCFQFKNDSPSLPPAPVSTSRTNRAVSPLPVYTVQFIVGSLDSPENVPRPSVYMPSTLASKSPYLRRRIQPPKHGDRVTQVVLVDAYYDALKLYKDWLQHGVVPKFRRSTSTPIPTPERKLLWSECFDLVRAHVLGSRFQHLEFSDFIMGELIRWLDPVQDADLDVLDFVFKERGVSEVLQCFVVDRMFADEAHVRKIFKLFLERKRKGRVGKFRMTSSNEYHSRYEEIRHELSEARHSQQRGEPSTAPDRLRPESETPLPTPPKPYQQTRYAPQISHRRASHRAVTTTREPQPFLTARNHSPYQRPVPFPPAPYLVSAANDALVRRYDVRRKPLPRFAWPLEEGNNVIARQSSWPILRPGVVIRADGEEELNRRPSVQKRPVPRQITELDGRSLTPEELLRVEVRPDSAP
ncbi:hypothetical protein DM02DRAFT_634054 [Periconia macrospinosa]|uniref:Uncharacterized protein n=1 Tax=Periconia macrospinosa TaxID=97972 RepID=A0A2V1D7K9_9PLEO|nr:hypothetical protein DM02DRAFT_634054 [Periconia macrospinosa]